MEHKTCDVEHLTFEFISSCSNKKQLERVVRVLRSGIEGFYPQLLKSAEERLKLVAPESVLLREQTSKLTTNLIPKEERAKLENDLNSWEDDMKSLDKALKEKATQLSKNLDPPKFKRVVNKEIKGTTTSEKKLPSQRIASGNYDAWEKFDVDKALLEMDIKEEKEVENQKRMQNIVQKTVQKIPIIQQPNDAKDLSEEMKRILSNKCKDKGNEYFKTSELELALSQYDASIEYFPTIAAYNNRAMTNIKLNNYEAAVADCDWVLEKEPNNVKALLRRGTARKCSPEKSNWKKAMDDFKAVITLEPSNKQAQSDYFELRKKLGLPEEEPKFRLKIEDLGVTQAKEVERLPITYYGPSTSNFRIEPYSIDHQMLTGPNIWGLVPCRCNCMIRQQNFLCRYCGERDIALAKRRSAIRFKTLKNIERKKAELAKSAQPKQTSQEFAYSNHVEITAPLSGEERSKKLAKEARDRGNVCMRERNFSQACAYFSTSIRLHSHLDAYKSRSLAYLKAGKYLEAAADCTVILQSEPKNVQILIRRAECYRYIGKEPYWKFALEDLTEALNLSPTNDALIQRELLAIKHQIMPHKTKNVKPDLNENEVPLPTEVPSTINIMTNGNSTEDSTSSKNSKNTKKKKKKKEKSKNSENGNKADQTNEILEETALHNGTSYECNDIFIDNFGGHEDGKRKHLSSNFFKLWESLRNSDQDFVHRIKLLRSIPAHFLSSVLGMKLDADLLSEIIRCLEIMRTDETAKYLKNLLKVERYSIAKIMLDPQDLNRLEVLLKSLPQNESA